MNAVKIVFLTIMLLAVAVLLMGVKILFVKGGTFKIGHAHDIAGVRKNKNN
ncbi:MAG: hypothetical protein HDS29_02355 [Bacteroides sp.]|nr:hypothetical protein [Bacteroides sp.]